MLTFNSWNCPAAFSGVSFLNRLGAFIQLFSALNQHKNKFQWKVIIFLPKKIFPQDLKKAFAVGVNFCWEQRRINILLIAGFRAAQWVTSALDDYCSLISSYVVRNLFCSFVKHVSNRLRYMTARCRVSQNVVSPYIVGKVVVPTNVGGLIMKRTTLI